MRLSEKGVAEGSRLATVSASRRQNQRLRITLVGSLPPIKGVSAYTSHLLESLASNEGLDLEFLGFRSIYPKALYPGGEPVDHSLCPGEYPGVSVRNILTWYNPFSWIWAGCTMKGDVVHAQWWSYILAPIYGTILAIAKLRGKRTVLTLHNVDPHERAWWKKALHRAIFFLGDRFIVHSESNKGALQRIYGRSAHVVSVISHGILKLAPLQGLSASAAKGSLGIPTESKTVLFFGNIRPYKGVEALLRSFPEVLAACTSTTLVVAGKPWSDWQPPDRLIDDLGVRSNVYLFLDFVPATKVEEFFAAADLVVLPYTRFDAQSGVGALALSFGRPLIVTDVGGLPDLVKDPRAVVPPGNPRALAEAIIRVLSDDSLRRKLEIDAEEVAARFSWGPIASRTADVYRTLVSGEGTSARGEHRGGSQCRGA